MNGMEEGGLERIKGYLEVLVGLEDRYFCTFLTLTKIPISRQDTEFNQRFTFPP